MTDTKKPRKRTAYALRVRMSDTETWSEPTLYATRRDRDNAERLNRCLGGIRTHSYEEKVTPEEFDDLLD